MSVLFDGDGQDLRPGGIRRRNLAIFGAHRPGRILTLAPISIRARTRLLPRRETDGGRSAAWRARSSRTTTTGGIARKRSTCRRSGGGGPEMFSAHGAQPRIRIPFVTLLTHERDCYPRMPTIRLEAFLKSGTPPLLRGVDQPCSVRFRGTLPCQCGKTMSATSTTTVVRRTHRPK